MSHLDYTSWRRRSRSYYKPRGLARGQRPDLEALEGRQLMASDLIGTSFPISPNPVEGNRFTAVVAKFTDADHNSDPAQYAATINWGNGQVTRGTIVVDPLGGFDVRGTFTFAKSGSFRVTAQIGDTDGDTATVSTTNIVTDAPITAIGKKISLKKGHSVSNVVVATFTDADASLMASDFSATIHWGDGRTSAGTIRVDKSIHGFDVLGSHAYKSAGTFSIQTKIQQGSALVVAPKFFTESDLISDGAVAADHINPNLVNPWGIVAPSPAHFWDSNNGAGNSSLFDSSGNVSTTLPFVTIPAPGGGTDTSAPTGVVFNGSAAFVVTNGTTSGPAFFIFATEDGTIAGWNPTVSSTTAVLPVDNSAAGAVYKGLTIFNVPAGNTLPAGQYIFAANFHAGTIDVFDQNFQPVTLSAGAFQDPNIPAGYAPFGIQSINGNLFVAYAKQDGAKHDDVAGPGNGFVDVYSPGGALIRRLGGPGTQSELNSPWGMTIAPSSFGQFSNDILVGNFGNSHISAFNPTTGAFVGQLTNSLGQPLVLNGGVGSPKGLWGIFAFGNGNGAGSTNTIYFATGFNDEGDGLFGSLTASTVASASAKGSVKTGA